jgi:hypothetical protein
MLPRLRIGITTTWLEGLVRIAQVTCKQNNVQVVDMHIGLTASGVPRGEGFGGGGFTPPEIPKF